jgi:hypothetical protein
MAQLEEPGPCEGQEDRACRERNHGGRLEGFALEAEGFVAGGNAGRGIPDDQVLAFASTMVARC